MAIQPMGASGAVYDRGGFAFATATRPVTESGQAATPSFVRECAARRLTPVQLAAVTGLVSFNDLRLLGPVVPAYSTGGWVRDVAPRPVGDAYPVHPFPELEPQVCEEPIIIHRQVVIWRRRAGGG